MNSKLMVPLSAALLGIVIGWSVNGSRSLASVESDKSAIVTLNQELAKSFNNKDLKASLAYYSRDPDALFYEDDAFALAGRDALEKYLQAFFSGSTNIQQELGPIVVVVNGDLAAAHYTILMTWKAGANSKRFRYRYSQILKRTDGKWVIWHEHLSVPYDPETGKAVMDAKS